MILRSYVSSTNGMESRPRPDGLPHSWRKLTQGWHRYSFVYPKTDSHDACSISLICFRSSSYLHTNRPLSTSRSIYLLYSYQCTIYVYCPSAAIRSFSCKQPHDRNVHNSTIISIRRPLASCSSLVTRDSLARISALSTLWYRSVCGQLKVNRSLRNKCVKVCHLTEFVVYFRS